MFFFKKKLMLLTCLVAAPDIDLMNRFSFLMHEYGRGGGIDFVRWSDGMRCCRSDWPGLCLFCCYQPSCVNSQQSWFVLFFCFINFPILLSIPTPRFNLFLFFYFFFSFIISPFTPADLHRMPIWPSWPLTTPKCPFSLPWRLARVMEIPILIWVREVILILIWVCCYFFLHSNQFYLYVYLAHLYIIFLFEFIFLTSDNL